MKSRFLVHAHQGYHKDLPLTVTVVRKRALSLPFNRHEVNLKMLQQCSHR